MRGRFINRREARSQKLGARKKILAPGSWLQAPTFLSSERKPFLLRIDPAVLQAVQRWADDDLRSLNGQIEWILRWALSEAGRARPKDEKPGLASNPQRSGKRERG